MINKQDIKPGAKFWFLRDGFIRGLPCVVHVNHMKNEFIFFDEEIDGNLFAHISMINDLYYTKNEAYKALAKCIKDREAGKSVYIFLSDSEINRIKKENIEFFL